MDVPILKSEKEIEKMAVSGAKVASLLEYLSTLVCPGITPLELDEAAALKIKEMGAVSSFYQYVVERKTYPRHICVSVDNQIIHGIPNKTPLKEGQIVSLDCGVLFDGWHGDSAITLPVGKIPTNKRKLLDVTYQALRAGIEAIKPGGHLSDIPKAIEKYVASQGSYGIVKDFGGHGIGRSLHEAPHIPNCGTPQRNYKLTPGLVIALEPMINLGLDKYKEEPDGWTISTADGKISAHFEHTIAITSAGPRVLTARKDEIF